jgi:hypothetical protein
MSFACTPSYSSRSLLASFFGCGPDLRAAASLKGSQGMQAVIDDTNVMYVTDDSPKAEPRYRIRFYFDPNSLTMANGDTHVIFRGMNDSSTYILRMELRFSSGSYQIRAALVDDGSAWTDTTWLTISDAPHSLELNRRAAGLGDPCCSAFAYRGPKKEPSPFDRI